MNYVSTRGVDHGLDFGAILLAGLARDGGLFVPESWPVLDLRAFERFAGGTYADVALEVMWPYVDGSSFDSDELGSIVADAYSTFDDPDVVPLRDLGDGLYLAELFHGPTLAFKDIALQLVGRLFDAELARRGQRVTIVGATSGDTGSAAIEACRDREAIDIFILHPEGRVSDVQRRQMTTVDAPNVHNIAIAGTFDDCQDLVKALFADTDFRDRRNLSAVNSINWARVMAQIVYYVRCAAQLGGGTQPVSFAVPTGNFGNVFAGYAAQRMGTPISQFIIGSNRNDILTRFLESGTMAMAGVKPTLSPAMDIQVSSNFERLLFELCNRDGARVAELMTEFRGERQFSVTADQLALLREHWDGACIDDDQTKKVIAATYEHYRVIVDPHTAVGLGAAQARRRDDGVPVVCLATAQPAKFPDAVEAAIGVRPALPDRLRNLLERDERFDSLPNDLAAVRDHIEGVLG
ncbi:MAG: threonine synthase [Actinobacteria bacterium]|nr:threonine synthase [Actinomycetota bacterium]